MTSEDVAFSTSGSLYAGADRHSPKAEPGGDTLHSSPGSMTLDILSSLGLAFLLCRNDLIQGLCGGLNEIMCVKHPSLQDQSITVASSPSSFASSGHSCVC